MERLIKIGKIKPRKASEIKNSRIGIGFEKLDRKVFNPEKAYDKLAMIGAKWFVFKAVGKEPNRKRAFMILNG